jgi:cytoskeletal protein RodZ
VEDPDKAEPSATEPSGVCIDADAKLQPGLFLQQSREALGLSLQDVAERTKIRSSLLQGIEEQRFDFLPAPVYLRGFLREFARMVKVPDTNAVIDAFMTLYENEQ